jgi:hypothetical protein
MKYFSLERVGKLWAIAACVLAAYSGPAQIYTFTSGNASATINLGSQAGMYNWTVNGVDQLNQQWFWYRVGPTGPERSIDTIGAPALTITPNSLTATYTHSQFNIRVDYVLASALPGSSDSTLTESITVNNTSGGPLDFHFFQYSDFDLGGTPGGDTVQLDTNVSGKYNYALQTDGPVIFSESNVVPGASGGEAAAFPVTLSSLNDGVATSLSGSAGPVSGDVTWAFQWDSMLDTTTQGSSFVLSKTKYISVPEPGALSLMGLSLAAWALRRRRSVC